MKIEMASFLKILASIILMLSPIVRAEGGPGGGPNDEAFFQMLRARAEKAQMEEEFNTPKKPELKKDRAVRGNRGAKITIVEYSDFQCPYCKGGFETVEALRTKYKDKLFFMFKHFPLPFHDKAMPAAKRFEAIALQNPKKAYEFHDKVFKNQEKLTEAYMDGVAAELKIDVAKMKKDMESDKVKKRIEADVEEAKKFGMSGTPGFVVMGVTLKGAYPIDSFEQIIERKLGEKKSPPAKPS